MSNQQNNPQKQPGQPNANLQQAKPKDWENKSARPQDEDNEDNTADKGQARKY